MRDEITHDVEAKILWTGDKSRLIETTIPLYDNHYKYFLPKKCTLGVTESDGDHLLVPGLKKSQAPDRSVASESAVERNP